MGEQIDPQRVAIAQHFADLGAPLLHPDYSTSAMRSSDGAVFLLAWADHKRTIGKGVYPFRLLLGHAAQGERRVHVEALTGAEPARGYLVVVSALDLYAKPRQVKTFNTGTVIPVGRVIALDGDLYAECLPPIPTRDAKAYQQTPDE